MFKHLLVRSTRNVLDVGHRVLPKLSADSRLAEPATVLKSACDDLDAAVQAISAAETAVRETEALRDDAGRKFDDLLREFGLMALSTGQNHHDVRPYVLYFPDGYGDLRRLRPQEAIRLANQIVVLLEKETDPKLAAYRQQIIDACAGFESAQGKFEAALTTRTDARAYGKTARSLAVRALATARHLTASICVEQPAYTNALFGPASGPRYTAPDAPATVETPGVHETPPVSVSKTVADAAVEHAA